MRRLVFPLMLVLFSLLSAAVLTTLTAVTLASYAKNEKGLSTAPANISSTDQATVSR